MGRRVAVTGIGLVTPIGIGKEPVFESMMAGRTGIGPVTRFDASDYACRIAAEVKDFRPEDYVEPKEARRLDRFAQFAVAAAKQALADAGLSTPVEEPERVGVIVGSGIGGIETFEAQFEIFREKGPRRVSPVFIPMLISNMAAGQVAIIAGARGHNEAVVTACATGSHAIGDALRVIQKGDADIIIAGGAEAAITPMGFAGFMAMRAMSTRNDEPEKALRPFDRDRDGFVMGEGAGILILEEMEHALARGAHVYAELIGYGATADAYHIVQPAPDGEGAARALALALKDAGIASEDVQYINAHGTGTDYNDRFETAAIRKVFGDHAYKLMVSSTKSMTGHLLGAAGGVEAAISVLAIERGVVPPTLNHDVPGEGCDLDYVPYEPRQAEVRVAMSNSFGFGGHNAVLVFAKPDVIR